MEFAIKRPDDEIRQRLIDKINNLTKPKGSLGMLESLALQIGWIQQTLTPGLKCPYNVVFAADHGIADEGVSFSPKEVTRQMIGNFLSGGAGVNFLARQHGFKLNVVDAGVDFDFPKTDGLIDMKVRKGSRNFLYGSALTDEEMHLCLERGAKVVRDCHAEGCNVISFGEMGIANTSTSSIWMHCLAGIPLDECVGAGSGLDKDGVSHKYEILKRAMANYAGDGSVYSVITCFGGYEMDMAVGAMLQAAELGMVVLVDGFIMTNCMLAASKICPEVLCYAIFGHQGDEVGHRLVLESMGAEPILRLGLRLGEGTGAICAYPIVDSAVRMINEMNTFSKASVTKYF